MFEASRPEPVLDEFDRQFSPILEPRRLRPHERLKSKVDPDDLKHLTVLLAGAALLMSGSQAKQLAINLDQQILRDRVECYADRDTGQFSADCSNTALEAFDIGAKAFTVIGFAGGMVLTGTLLASQFRRRYGEES